MNDLNSRLLFYGLLLSIALLMPNTVYAIDPITEIKMLTSQQIINHVNNTAIISQIEHAQYIAIHHSKIVLPNQNYTIPVLPANMTSQICKATIDTNHNMTISCINGGNDTQ